MLKTIIWFAASTSSHISSQFEQSLALKRNKGRTIGNGLRDLKGIANISAKHSELSTVSTKREMSAPGPCVADSFRLSGSVLCKNWISVYGYKGISLTSSKWYVHVLQDAMSICRSLLPAIWQLCMLSRRDTFLKVQRQHQSHWCLNCWYMKPPPVVLAGLEYTGTIRSRLQSLTKIISSGSCHQSSQSLVGNFKELALVDAIDSLLVVSKVYWILAQLQRKQIILNRH